MNDRILKFKLKTVPSSGARLQIRRIGGRKTLRSTWRGLVVLGCGCVLVPGSAGRSGSRWPVRAAVGSWRLRPGPVARVGPVRLRPKPNSNTVAPKSSKIILRACVSYVASGTDRETGENPSTRQSLRPIHMYTDRRYRSERLNHIVH